MTVKGTGGYTVAAVPSAPSPSLSKPGQMAATWRGVVDIEAFSVVIGETTTTTPPATLAALANTSTYTVSELTNASYRLDPDNTYSGSGAVVGSSSGDPAWTIGHYAWVCLFALAAPISSSVPSVSFGPFLIVA